MLCAYAFTLPSINPTPWRAQQQQQPGVKAIGSRQQRPARSISMLAAVMPSPASTKVSFTNSHGNKLAGILTLSSSSSSSNSQQAAGAACQAGDSASPSKCVILCHGYASYKDGFQLPAIAAALAEAGYNSLRFDFTGNGESEGHFKFANYIGEVEDIRAARQWLQQEAGQTVVALLGHSKGGDDVILYAKLHGDIPLVINVAGRFDLTDGIEQRFGAEIFNRVLHEPVLLPAQREDGHSWTWHLTPQDLEERLSLDMAAAAAGVKHCKVLTVHGTADKTISVEDGRKFAAVLPGHRIVEVEGADHNFTGDNGHLQQLLKAVLDFLQQEEFSLPQAPADSSNSLQSPQ